MKGVCVFCVGGGKVDIVILAGLQPASWPSHVLILSTLPPIISTLSLPLLLALCPLALSQAARASPPTHHRSILGRGEETPATATEPRRQPSTDGDALRFIQHHRRSTLLPPCARCTVEMGEKPYRGATRDTALMQRRAYQDGLLR